jgi:hypothetical protein
MATWIKNLIGLAFVVVILGVAKQVWFDSADTELNITEGKIKTTNVVRSPSPPAAEPKVQGKSTVAKTQTWTADSGWRKGGSSPGEFCGAQKLAREAKFPDRTVVLIDMPHEQHKTVRDPFKRDYYRYTCVFEDRWYESTKEPRTEKGTS